MELDRYEGEKGRFIRVISAYRVSQDYPDQAGETTSCKQQVRSLMFKGIKNPNPQKIVLLDLFTMIQNWRSDKVNCDIILMADMNKHIGNKKIYFFVSPTT